MQKLKFLNLLIGVLLLLFGYNLVSAQDSALKLYPSTEEGTSAAFERSAFLSFPGAVPATVISGAVILPTKFGLTEFFGASSSSETTAKGAVYFQAPGIPPVKFREVPGYRITPTPGFVQNGTGYIWFSTRLNSRKESSIWMSIVNANLKIVSEKRLMGIAGSTYQSYKVMRMTDGSIVMPVCYTLMSKIYSGPWRVRVYRSRDNGKTWSYSNARSYAGRGLLEPQPYQKPNGSIGIFARTDRGYLAKLTYNPKANYLSAALATPFLSPSAGASVINLPNGRVALAYVPGIPKILGSNFPRAKIALAVSKDDFVTLEAVHILAVASSLGGDGISNYVHQPRLEFYQNKLIVYFNQVQSSTAITTWRLTETEPLETTDNSLTIPTPLAPALRDLALLK